MSKASTGANVRHTKDFGKAFFKRIQIRFFHCLQSIDREAAVQD